MGLIPWDSVKVSYRTIFPVRWNNNNLEEFELKLRKLRNLCVADIHATILSILLSVLYLFNVFLALHVLYF